MVIDSETIYNFLNFDNISILYIVPIVMSFFLIMVSKLKMNFIHLIVLVLNLNYIGVVFYSNNYNDFYPAIVFATGMVIFSLSIFIFSKFSRFRDINYSLYASVYTLNRQQYQYAIITFFILVVFMSTMLFMIKGIPILSEDANIDRFTISEGTGIYSRFLKFGLPSLFIISTIYFFVYKNTYLTAKMLMLLSFIITTFYFIMLGNKGALITIFFILFITITNMQNTDNYKKNIFKLFLFALFSVVVAVIISSIILHIDLVTASALILYRITAMAGMGFFDIVHEFTKVNGFQYGFGQINGFYDLLSTFRILPRGDHTFLGLELSYFMVNMPVDTNSDTFVFPITITLFGDFYYDFGIYGVIIGSILFAYISLSILNKTKQSSSLTKLTVYIIIQFLMLSYTMKGSLLGIINNELVSYLFIVSIYFIIYSFYSMLKKNKRVISNANY